MPLNLDTYLGVAGQALKVQSRRMEVLADNIANVDTPNYKARDIDFRAALAAAGSPGSTLQPVTTSPQDVTAGSSADGVSTQQFLKYRIPLAPSLDGNTVDSQMEESQFAQNTVRFQATLTFLNDRFSELTTAITGGQ